VPLLIGERVVGVLDMQSREVSALNQNILTAFEVLAGQLAIAIQNDTFLAEMQQARAEVEIQARRLSHANWEDYLDAIHQPEQAGFVFEKNQILPLEETESSHLVEGMSALSASISVVGEQLGELIVDVKEENQTTQAVELVNIVARQIAQHIENLRLLESAERYRFEAEQATRRITREGWKDYMDANAGESLSYIYDLKEVRPFNQVGDQQAEESAFNLPLKVRDETVGKLSVLGLKSDDKESLDFVNAVAERLGAHIDGLRLSTQTEQALAATQKLAQREQALRQITSAVRGSTDPATILRSAARELGTLLGRKTIVRLKTAHEAQASQLNRSADLVEDAAATSENVSVPPAESPKAVGGDE
jgi:GAF domain-containing protein